MLFKLKRTMERFKQKGQRGDLKEHVIKLPYTCVYNINTNHFTLHYKRKENQCVSACEKCELND